MKYLLIALALLLAPAPAVAAITPSGAADSDVAFYATAPSYLITPAVETTIEEPQPMPPPDGKVVVNIGQWLDVAQEFFLALLTLALTAIIGLLPMPVRAVIQTWRVNQMAMQAARFGLSRAKEKLKAQLGPDGTITIPVKNAAAEMGAEYALEFANKAVSEFAGGKNGWQQKIIARIEEMITSVTTEYKERIKSAAGARSK